MIVQKEKENKKHVADAVEKGVNLKLQDIQHKIRDVTKEKKVAADVSYFILLFCYTNHIILHHSIFFSVSLYSK